MGWKNLKEHFRIEHIVHVAPEGIRIGSPYISDILVVSREGRLTKRDEETSNKDLVRYQREISADPATAKRLIETPDHFAKSVTVFTYDGSRIIESACENPGWPNVTHDGVLMYENTHSTDRDTVARWAKENAIAGVKLCSDQIARKEKELAELRKDLAASEADLAKLNAEFPGVVVKPTDR